MHRVDGHMMKLHARASEDAGGLGPLPCQRFQVRSMVNPSSPVRRIATEIHVAERAGLGGIAEPAKLLTADGPEPET